MEEMIRQALSSEDTVSSPSPVPAVSSAGPRQASEECSPALVRTDGTGDPGSRPSAPDRAEAYFLQGYNCSQAVFAAFAGDYGIPENMALRLASTLGAGVSAMREVCGAVSAMSMVCGLEEGNAVAGTDRKKAAYEANRKLLDQFSDRWGSIICREILQIRKDEKRQAPSERTPEYYRKRPCLAVVRSAAEILEQAYGESPEKDPGRQVLPGESAGTEEKA